MSERHLVIFAEVTSWRGMRVGGSVTWGDCFDADRAKCYKMQFSLVLFIIMQS